MLGGEFQRVGAATLIALPPIVSRRVWGTVSRAMYKDHSFWDNV